MSPWLLVGLLLGVVVVLAISVWGWIKVFSTFNSADGERYRKLKMQGPFVPLSKEDIDADARRIQARHRR